MKPLNIIFVFTIAFLVMGCGVLSKSAENTQTAKTKEIAPAAETKKNETSSTSTGETSGVTGVAACDEYLAKVERLLENPKVPQATRDMYKQTLEQNRTAWKQAASTPQAKAGLETSCKMALDAMKPTLEQFDK